MLSFIILCQIVSKNSKARFNLGSLFENGLGVKKKNEVEALRLYQLAANDCNEAQSRLVSMGKQRKS